MSNHTTVYTLGNVEYVAENDAITQEDLMIAAELRFSTYLEHRRDGGTILCNYGKLMNELFYKFDVE